MTRGTLPETGQLAYEDFEPGITIALGSRRITAEEIVEFAREFDDQAMHVDEASGARSLLGGLGASGWHTCALFIRMASDAFLLRSTTQGAPGVDYVRWKRPVLAGDTLTGLSEVVERRLSRSRPELGLVTMVHRLFNQRGETVMELRNTVMFLCRGENR
jgi:acyl dehydratase